MQPLGISTIFSSTRLRAAPPPLGEKKKKSKYRNEYTHTHTHSHTHTLANTRTHSYLHGINVRHGQHLADVVDYHRHTQSLSVPQHVLQQRCARAHNERIA